MLVLVHGWGRDHTTLLRQQAHFAATHRIINVDLRGHGESAAPEQVYSVEQFADDLAWICRELKIERAMVVGHSMGGAIALETALRHPDLVGAVGLIDTVFQAPSELQEILTPLVQGLRTIDYERVYRSLMQTLCLAEDAAELEPILRSLPRAPQHVQLSAMQQHLEVHDFAKAAVSCSVAVAYIATGQPLADVAALKLLIPALKTGHTLGSGHFAPWLVYEQVNAMLARFFELVERRQRARRGLVTEEDLATVPSGSC